MLLVVRSVAVPPRVTAKASGINSREGLARDRRAASITAGISNAAAARLFMNSERDAPITIVRSSRRVGRPRVNQYSPSPIRCVTPVRYNPWVRMKMARMVMTAGREKPEKASWRVMTPATTRPRARSSATRSARNHSVTIKMMATVRSNRVISAWSVISVPPQQAARILDRESMASRNEACLSGNVLDSDEIIHLGWGPWAIEIISGIRFVWQP